MATFLPYLRPIGERPSNIVNTEPLCLSALQTPEVAIYPDSGKAGFTVGVSPAGVSSRQFQRLGELLPYYGGEDG